MVESFKSTLDEVRESDLLLQVVDISHPQYEDHIKVVNKTLKDLGADNIPMLYVFNKMDLYREKYLDEFLMEEEKANILEGLKTQWMIDTKGQACFISALPKEGLDEFKAKLKDLVNDLYQKRYPYKTKFW